MEKRKPSYDLAEIQRALGSADGLSMTTTASLSATALGFSRKDVVDLLNRMERRMFFKSMTTFADHKLWQDVYHVPAGDMMLYIKFQADVVTEFTVMSFKEK